MSEQFVLPSDWQTRDLSHVMVIGEEPAGIWVGCVCGWEASAQRFDEAQAREEHEAHLASL